jgi:S-methylmethionine-dependent homocysteine/selenocysteine methylase
MIMKGVPIIIILRSLARKISIACVHSTYIVVGGKIIMTISFRCKVLYQTRKEDFENRLDEDLKSQ